MLAKRIIPCLDVKDGRNVRGVRFSADRDAGDPVELAARYDRDGADELVFYDITASAQGRAIVLDLVREVSERVFIPLTVGGGIRSFADVRAILKGGADKVSLNSAAVRDPQIIRRAAGSFGSQCIVGAIDALRRPGAPPERSWSTGSPPPPGGWPAAPATRPAGSSMPWPSPSPPSPPRRSAGSSSGTRAPRP